MGMLIPRTIKNQLDGMNGNYTFQCGHTQLHFIPQSFPMNANQASVDRLSAVAFKWLKKSDLLPPVSAFAFIVTSFNCFRNSAKPAKSGF